MKEVTLWDDDHVEPKSDLVPPENLSYQAFSSVSLDRATQFLCRRDPQPTQWLLVCQQKHGEVSTVDFCAAVVNLLEFGAPTNMLGTPKAGRHSLLTVRRLRPFARRRFSTRRPFFVLILTRKPCVRFLRRVFGWNVRFPFIDHSKSAYRTANVSSLRSDRATVSVLQSGQAGVTRPYQNSMTVWSLTRVFHTCGKNCGKAFFFTCFEAKAPAR